MMNLERCRIAYSFQGSYGFREARIPEFNVSSNTVKDKDNRDHQGSVKILITFSASSTIILRRKWFLIRAVDDIVRDTDTSRLRLQKFTELVTSHVRLKSWAIFLPC